VAHERTYTPAKAMARNPRGRGYAPAVARLGASLEERQAEMRADWNLLAFKAFSEWPMGRYAQACFAADRSFC
jgi:uncharacterized protein YukE